MINGAHERRRRAAAALVVAVFGLAVVGTGVYFMVLRPAVLPEDLRFTTLRQGEISPALADWLKIVFRTWGGFIVGLGLAILGQGLARLTGRLAWSPVGLSAGFLFAFGSFLVSNIQIRSDFLWFVGLLFIGALASAIALLRARPR